MALPFEFVLRSVACVLSYPETWQEQGAAGRRPLAVPAVDAVARHEPRATAVPAVAVHPPPPVSAGRLAEYKRIEETPRGGAGG